VTDLPRNLPVGYGTGRCNCDEKPDDRCCKLGHPGVVPIEMMLPKATVRPSRYTVNCLPEGVTDGDLFAISVSYRGHGKWWVHRGEHRSLAADGTWSWGFNWSGGDREPETDAEQDSFNAEHDKWVAERRFDEATAIKLAKAAAPHITVGRVTVAEALKFSEENGS
jgi:hypothetical protein